MKVKATQLGYHHLELVPEGKEFHIEGENEISLLWMEPVCAKAHEAFAKAAETLLPEERARVFRGKKKAAPVKVKAKKEKEDESEEKSTGDKDVL